MKMASENHDDFVRLQGTVHELEKGQERLILEVRAISENAAAGIAATRQATTVLAQLNNERFLTIMQQLGNIQGRFWMAALLMPIGGALVGVLISIALKGIER